MQTVTSIDNGSHLGLLPYDNNGRKCELDEIDTSIVIFSPKP